MIIVALFNKAHCNTYTVSDIVAGGWWWQGECCGDQLTAARHGSRAVVSDCSEVSVDSVETWQPTTETLTSSQHRILV